MPTVQELVKEPETVAARAEGDFPPELAASVRVGGNIPPEVLAGKTDHYTYADVLEWPEDFLAEIIDGELFVMAPPLRIHQEISGNIYTQIKNWLRGRAEKVYAAPFGVRLFPRMDKSDRTFLMPDIVVVCDPAKLDDYGCSGAPDLVVEILSPSTARRDRVIKQNSYREAGVREFWIVDPESRSLEVCVLDNGRYVPDSYADTATVPVAVLPGCEISLPEVFAP